MTDDQITRILEAISLLSGSVSGVKDRLEHVEKQAEENGLALAGLTSEVRGLGERVNRMNPVWTFIFKATQGYGNLVTTNTLTKTAALAFWSVFIAVLVLSVTARMGFDTRGALKEVEMIGETSKDIVEMLEYPRPYSEANR